MGKQLEACACVGVVSLMKGFRVYSRCYLWVFTFMAFLLDREGPSPVFILVNTDFLETSSRNGLLGPAAQFFVHCHDDGSSR